MVAAMATATVAARHSPPPRLPRVEWVLLVLDALVVAFCAVVFAVGLGEALHELGLSTAVVV